MKKTISLLLVVLLASACLFADVSLTGELGFGYKVNFNGTVENKDYLNLDSTYGGFPITTSNPSLIPNIHSASKNSALLFLS